LLLAHHLGSRLSPAELHGTVTLLFETLQQQDPLLYEAALLMLSRLVATVPDPFTAERRDVMLGSLRFSLESGSSGVPNAASILVGVIFQISAHELRDELASFVETEERLLNTRN
jgi:hypothetical protein